MPVGEVFAEWRADGVWYRAHINSKEQTSSGDVSYLVTFLDYGNQDVCTEDKVRTRFEDIPPEAHIDAMAKAVEIPRFRSGLQYAKWRYDGSWYRCNVLPTKSTNNDEVTVLFTDYGNQDTVSWRTELVPLPTDIPQMDSKDVFVQKARVRHNSWYSNY